jgi:hypothetical protein
VNSGGSTGRATSPFAESTAPARTSTHRQGANAKATAGAAVALAESEPSFAEIALTAAPGRPERAGKARGKGTGQPAKPARQSKENRPV